MTDFKELYKHTWNQGNYREAMFMGLMQDWGYEVKPFGFEVMSNAYNPDRNHEPGMPDFYIDHRTGKKVYFEVTGTFKLDPKNEIWVRPDKIKYVRRHLIACFIVHVITLSRLIRFIDAWQIDPNNYMTKTIRGVEERYCVVPPDQLMSQKAFRSMYIGWKGDVYGDHS